MAQDNHCGIIFLSSLKSYNSALMYKVTMADV
jgi:hypothetical protein